MGFNSAFKGLKQTPQVIPGVVLNARNFTNTSQNIRRAVHCIFDVVAEKQLILPAVYSLRKRGRVAWISCRKFDTLRDSEVLTAVIHFLWISPNDSR